MIFDASEANKIDYKEVLTTSFETLRFSIDSNKTFVKWQGEKIPACLNELTTKEGPYNYEQMLEIIKTPEWTKPFE